MARIVDKATAVASMLAGGDWATGAYLRTLFDGNDPGTYVVLKPSPETSPDVIRLGELIAASGFPPGVVNIVTGGRGTGEALVTHPDVDLVSFTGSTAAGRSGPS